MTQASLKHNKISSQLGTLSLDLETVQLNRCYSNHFTSPPGYTGVRNLPSAGFFPFLQTLMCNADSTCNNKSRVVDPAATKSAGDTR